MFVEREIRKKFEKINKVYNMLALVGARQSGKTTFLKHELEKIKGDYVLFDDPDVRKLFEEDIKKFEIQYIVGRLSVLDEVQYCNDAGIKLKYLAEKGHKIWLTSSSEIILSKEILSYLVGRVSIIRMYPFSFAEFLDAKNKKEFAKETLNRLIWEHCAYGGYPKVVTTDDIETKRIILKDLYETMILKDIAKTFSIEDINSLEETIKYLSLNIGGLIAYGDISKMLSISFQTLKKYLNAMEKSHLIIKVKPFFTNKIKEITKQPKIYFLDTGLRNNIAKNFPQDMDGKLFENYVLSELIKIGFSPKYWRTKTNAEVDFIVEKEKEIIPVEVKINHDNKIEKSLHNFIEIYKPKKAIIVSYAGEKTKRRESNCEVIFTDVIGLKEILQKE